MDSDLGRLFWSVDGDPFFDDPSYFTETSKVDVLQIDEGGSSNPASFLLSLCIPSRNVHYDDSAKPWRYEFWYGAVLKSSAKPQAMSQSKRVLGWSFMHVWAATDLTTDTTTILIAQLGTEAKRRLLNGSSDVYTQLLSHPMLVHLFILQSVAENHRRVSSDLSRSLSRQASLAPSRCACCSEECDNSTNFCSQEHFEDQETSGYTRLSKQYLLQCRQMTSFVIDNDLVQDVVLRVIEENKWVYNHWPRPETGSAEAMWKRSCETVDEGLRCQLANLKISGRYARLVEDRARIGIDECRAAINQHDAENNLKLAEESTKLTNASTKDSRSLAKLQYLAMITLPLSLASSIFGMGFFSTTSSPSGEAQLLVSSSWWYYPALALPLTAFTVLSWYSIMAWDTFRERIRRPSSKPALDDKL
ncbi:MAG: hypothetical protein Q9173_004150 [Seirophora scorigena]